LRPQHVTSGDPAYLNDVLCDTRIVQQRYLFFVKLCFDNIMSIIMKVGGSKRDHLSAFNSVQFTMYYKYFFNVDAVVCQNNGQFQVWELNI
jgi:hypothetical protein